MKKEEISYPVLAAIRLSRINISKESLFAGRKRFLEDIREEAEKEQRAFMEKRHIVFSAQNSNEKIFIPIEEWWELDQEFEKETKETCIFDFLVKKGYKVCLCSASNFKEFYESENDIDI